ncbi:hypothetical protein BKI52_28280 [marine bacterium AO1-C]|nr:hypothetical protein BKI52_28280 [marine bacterium AO1-C]
MKKVLLTILCVVSTGMLWAQSKKVDSLKKALQTVRTDTGKVNLLNTLALNDKGFKKRKAWGDQALKLSTQTKYKKGEAHAHLRLAYVYSDYAKYQESNRYYLKALQLFKELKDEKNIAQSYYNLALDKHYNSDYPAGLKYQQEAAKIYKALGNNKRLFLCYFEITVLYRLQGNYEQSASFAQKALKIAQEIKNERYESMVYNSIAITYMRQENKAKALEFYIKSLKLKEKIGFHRGAARTATNIAEIYLHNKEYDKAKEYYDKYFDIAQKMPESKAKTILTADALTRLGNFLFAQQQYKEALAKLHQSLNISTKAKLTSQIFETKGVIGRVYHDQQKYKEAIRWYDEVIEGLEKINSKTSTGTYTLLAAQVLTKLNNLDKAREYLVKGLRIANEVKNPNLKMDAYLKHYEFFKKNKESSKALQYYEKYTEIKDSLFTETKEKQIAGIKIAFETEKKEQQIVLLQKEKTVIAQDKKISRLIAGVIGVVLLLVTISTVLIISGQRIKMRKNKEIWAKEQTIYEKEQRIAEEKNRRTKAEKEKLESELNLKNQQLTSHTLHMIQKNQTLNEINVQVNQIRQQKSITDAKKLLNRLSNLIDYGINVDKDWESFQRIFDQLHPSFYNSLKVQYPLLTSSDLHLSALLKLNLNTKEIASLLNITPKSTQMKRHRLRQKMNIDSDARLTEFMIQFDSA